MYFYLQFSTGRVTETNSLFYYVSPESWDSMNDASFTPIFLEDLKDQAPKDKLLKAQEVCGQDKMCLYDSLALNDTNIGMATLSVNAINMESMVLSSKCNSFTLPVLDISRYMRFNYTFCWYSRICRNSCLEVTS